MQFENKPKEKKKKEKNVNVQTQGNNWVSTDAITPDGILYSHQNDKVWTGMKGTYKINVFCKV